MRQINNWDDADARRQATRAFCAFLHRPETAEAREKCKSDPGYARMLFAQQGGFCLEEELTPDESNPIVPIPHQTDFRVFEETDMFPRRPYFVRRSLASSRAKNNTEGRKR